MLGRERLFDELIGSRLTLSQMMMLLRENPLSTGEIAEIVYNDSRYHMYKYPIELERTYGDELEATEYRNRHVNRLIREDSIHHVEKKVISMKDIANNRLVHDGDTILKTNIIPSIRRVEKEESIRPIKLFDYFFIVRTSDLNFS